MIKRIILLILLVLLIANFAYRIDEKKSPHELMGELAYFPSGKAVKMFSVGLYAPFADVIWLRFVQYYGEHRMHDAKFDIMYHILDILTTLDQRFAHAYTLGSLLLTHDANKPDEAKQLLQKAMRLNPEDWRFSFMYGFINYVFLRKFRVAETYFRISAQAPNAPDVPKRWAAFILYMKMSDLKTALGLWVDLYNHSTNPEERSIALKYIKSIKMDLDIEMLNNKIGEFTKKMQRPPAMLHELITYGLIDSIPVEPHGKNYVISQGKVISTYKK